MQRQRDHAGEIGEQADAAGGAADDHLGDAKGDCKQDLHERKENKSATIAGEHTLTKFAPGRQSILAGDEHDMADEGFGGPVDEADDEGDGKHGDAAEA